MGSFDGRGKEVNVAGIRLDTTNDYLRDVLDQPAALHDTLAALPDEAALAPFAAQLAAGDLRRVVLTGMGSSCHALHPLAIALVGRGIAAQVLETSELVHYAPTLLEPSTLVVAVSQSGRSVEILRLLEQVRGRAPVVGVTNTPDSPLAMGSDAVVLTRAGEEFTVSCKTYAATLVGLAWLGDALSGSHPLPTCRALGEAADAAARYLALWRSHVEALCGLLEGVRYLILAGRGPSLAAVGTGGLIIKESAHFPAEGMSSASFRHGPLEMAAPDLFVLVYAGVEPTAGLNARLVEDVRAAGGRAALVGGPTTADFVFALPEVPTVALPVLEILPAQMVSFALAELHGHAAGSFRHAAKVTTAE